jgi:hypothetical protein
MFHCLLIVTTAHSDRTAHCYQSRFRNPSARIRVFWSPLAHSLPNLAAVFLWSYHGIAGFALKRLGKLRHV